MGSGTTAMAAGLLILAARWACGASDRAAASASGDAGALDSEAQGL